MKAVKKDYTGIMTFAQQAEGAVSPVSLELIGKARERLTLQARTPGGLVSDDYAALDREYLERGLRDLSILEGMEEPV